MPPTTANRTLLAKFDGDTRGLSRATGRAERNLRGFDKAADGATRRAGRSFEKFSRAAKGLGVVLGSVTLGATGAVAAIDRIGEDALNMRTAVDKAQRIFGDSFTKIEKAAENTAIQMGMTTREFQIQAAAIGDFLVPMGFARSAAADLALKYSDLAGKLSVWSAGQLSAADVTELFQSALTGEFDSLQRLGIQINAARVEQEAEAIQKSSAKDLTDDMARALAVEKIAREDSTDALDFYNSEAGEASRKAQEQKTKLRELTQEMQEKLIPVYEKLWQWVAQNVVPALEDFVVWLDSPDGKRALKRWGENLEETGEVIQDVAGWIGDLVGAIRTLIGWMDTAQGHLDTFLDGLEDAPGRIGGTTTAIRNAADAYSGLPGFSFLGPFGRAHGGPVHPGGTYLVGEKGPELLTLGNVGGHVTPNNQLGGGMDVRVFIGDTELRGIIRVEVDEHDRDVRDEVTAGFGGR